MHAYKQHKFFLNLIIQKRTNAQEHINTHVIENLSFVNSKLVNQFSLFNKFISQKIVVFVD